MWKSKNIENSPPVQKNYNKIVSFLWEYLIYSQLQGLACSSFKKVPLYQPDKKQIINIYILFSQYIA